MTQASRRPPLLVGLTGGIGSGKTTVADLFADFGVPLIDTDVIAHQLTGPGGAAMAAIEAEFGRQVIAADGRLDRGAMRALAFGDPQARQRLEAILHPMIGAETWRQVEAASDAPYAIVVIPLLVESGRWRQVLDRVLVVDCPVDVQVARVMTRSALSRGQVEAIMAAQASREQRLAAADDVIENAGATAELGGKARELHDRYLALSRAAARRQGLSTQGV